MAQVRQAPKALQAVSAQAAAYLRANFSYGTMYRSYDTRKGAMRVKLYGLRQRMYTPRQQEAIRAHLHSLGFTISHSPSGKLQATLYHTVDAVLPRTTRTPPTRKPMVHARPRCAHCGHAL